MSLDLARLENVRQQGGKMIARCPACAEAGMDEKGEHLVIQADGRFGCVVHPGADGKPHRQRIAKLVGTRGVPTINVRVASAVGPKAGTSLPILNKERKPQRSLRNEPQLGSAMFSLECGDPDFREPENGEWIVALYREDDGTAFPLLLWADPDVDLFWDVARREHVMPPKFYLRLAKQPPIDPITGYPLRDGAVCPF